ncbi:hypothetical protein WMF38_14750 [Sorangium sp. So ce118]
MSSYALSSGRPVPGWVMETLVWADEGGPPPAQDAEAPPADEPAAPVQDMLVRQVTRAHVDLAKRIAPMTPDLVILLEAESKVSRVERLLGTTRISRSFMVIAIFSLATFIAATLSEDINQPANGDIIKSSGFPLLVSEIFFLSAAAVGASFAGLFKIDRDLTDGTFSPKRQSSYWVQLVLGLVAGLLLATLLNVNAVAASDEQAFARTQFSSAGLALLGGFSSSAVQRVLQRLIETLEAIVRGSGEQELAAREQASKQKIEQIMATERVRLSATLTDLQRRLATGESSASVQRLLDRLNRQGAESLEGLMDQASAAAPGPAAPTSQSGFHA